LSLYAPLLLLICLHENYKLEAEYNKARECLNFNQNIDLLQTRKTITLEPDINV